MRYLTLISVIHNTDEGTVGQYVNGLKTWWKTNLISDLELHIGVNGNRDSKANVLRQVSETCDAIKLNFKLDWDETKSKVEMLNRIVFDTKTPYIAMLPFPAWRETFALQNQLAQLKSNFDFTYGDYVTCNNLNDVFQNLNRNTTLERTYDLGRGKTKQYYQRIHQWGDFAMWKRSLHDYFNYFDESLHTCYDMDFVNRLLEKTQFRIGKTNGIMGATTSKIIHNRDEEQKVYDRFTTGKPVKIICFGKETEWSPK